MLLSQNKAFTVALLVFVQLCLQTTFRVKEREFKSQLHIKLRRLLMTCELIKLTTAGPL